MQTRVAIDDSLASEKKATGTLVGSLFDMYRSNLRFSVGISIIFLFLVFGFIVPLLAPVQPAKWHTVPRDLPPQLGHLLGTTSLGQSVFWFLSRAIGNSFVIGFVVAALGTVVGVIVGIVAGFNRGILSTGIGILIDTFIAIPALPILILLASLLQGKASIFLLCAILSAFNWAWPARQVRSMVLTIRERAFIDVAFFANESTWRIIYKEILPHILSWAGANFTNTVLVAIGSEMGLAVLGLSSPERPTLGTMIYWALQYQALLRGIWWWLVPPVVTTVVLFVSLFLTSSGLQDYRAVHRVEA